MGEVQMPKYKCHKEVWALKISSIRETVEGTVIVPSEKGYGEFIVDKSYVEKHKPVAGGYYVVYQDGYKSFSPASAFEEGYSLVK